MANNTDIYNATLGQYGSSFITGDGGTVDLNGTSSTMFVIAITMLADTTFSLLTPENANYLTVPGKGYESLGDTTATSDTFPKGVTIYGRWTTVDVNAGNIVAYIAG